MKRLHMMRSDDWGTAYCGVSLEEDTRAWTMDRRVLLRSGRACKKCAKQSKVHVLPLGGAAAELQKLEYLKRLGQPRKWTPTGLERAIVRCLERSTSRMSTAEIALEVDLKISAVKQCLTDLYYRGAVCKLRSGWLICDEVPTPVYKIVRPE